ncbi:MAG: DUF4175 family protein [Candidatus Fervidibacter sp.]|uniref:DUF4175 family protein n=1 Tax=Candidatus Fervidibacter sp. TaxID=3100871 RepID=UPI00404B0394
MDKAQTMRIGERFEIAKALRKSVQRLAWKRRFWTILAALGLPAAATALLIITLSALTFFFDYLSPFAFVWSVRLNLALFGVAVALIALTSARWFLKEKISEVLAAIDSGFGGEVFRNSFDLANLREDEQFVSPHFARIAIVRAWQKWQQANQEGVLNALTAPHFKRSLFSLSVAISLSLLAFALSRSLQFSFSDLWAIYNDCQAALAFERNGRLRLSVKEDGKKDGVVLKGSVICAHVDALCPNRLVPKRLKVWLEWRTNNGKTERFQMRRTNEDKFIAKLKVSESGVLQAVSGNVKSNQVNLQTVNPPTIAEWLVTIEPPTYTNLKTETFGSGKWQPLIVLKGSRVTVVATATETLEKARSEFYNSGNLSVKTDLTFDDRTVQWSGVVLAPVRMKWRFVDKFGFSGETDWLTINVCPDKPPKVVVLPGANLVVAGGFVPLTVRAEDDFGISELKLQLGLSDAKRVPTLLRSIPLNISPSQQVEQTLALPVPVDAVGKVMWVRAIAKDNDEVSGFKSASSDWVLIRIGEPEDLIGTLEDWLVRLKAWENWLQKGEWEKAQRELSKWLQRWTELMEQARWTGTPLPYQWLANWLSHWQEHLPQKDLANALQELWQVQGALERALSEQRLAELVQKIAALRSEQEAIYDALRRHARPSSLAPAQRKVTERVKDFVKSLKEEADLWERLNKPTVAFTLSDVARVLEQRPTERAMTQAQSAMEQELREMALLRTYEALSDLREAEELLTSPIQSPLAQLYRRERNLLAQLLEQTERLRREQESLRRETERVSPPSDQQGTSETSIQKTVNPLIPPSPPLWEEVEKLSIEGKEIFPPSQKGLTERQQQLRQRTEQLRRPLSEAISLVPQLSPDAPHKLQSAISHMTEAVKSLQQGVSASHRRQAISHQRQAENALQRLAEDIQEALIMEHGTATQRMGAGENEAMSLARRQAQLLRETQRLHRQQQQGQAPHLTQLRQLGAEEGAIGNALVRMEGFFGDALPTELRQRVQHSLQNLRWLEQNLPEGRLGESAQQRQQQVLETLLQLAQVLSGQQVGQRGQQQVRQGQEPSRPDIYWGRFVEHGPPMRQVPEALQGVKGGASFTEPARNIYAPPPKPMTVPRVVIPPPYREPVQKYQRQIR